MAYDEQLAGRVRRALARHGTMSERRMFVATEDEKGLMR